MIDRVLVVGTGLIGTSVGLALRATGVDVTLDDADSANLLLAVELGAGRPADPQDPPADHAVLAVPPAAVAAALAAVQDGRRARTASDVASVKRAPLDAAAAAGCDLSSFIGGHPLAGRERSGPAAARADLFLGAPWVLTPQGTSAPTLAAAEDVVRRCGADPIILDPDAHDEAVALVSHAPQLTASALAALLVDATPAALRLAGQGLRDMTRIADSDPTLWAQIATANAAPLAGALERLAAELRATAAALRGPTPGLVAEVLAAGQAGRQRLPGKHNRPAATYAPVPVVVRDEPGQLARLLVSAAAAGVNVEDLRVEHAPGAPVGVIELAVQPSQVAPLSAALAAEGWSVQAGASKRPA